MKKLTVALSLATVAGLTVVWMLWPSNRTRPVESDDPTPTPKRVAHGPAPLEAEAAAFSPADSSPASTRAINPGKSPEPSTAGLESADSRNINPSVTRSHEIDEAAPPDVVEVYAGQTLATVNRTPVRLRDLMPVRPEEKRKKLTREQYTYRLQRAIEMVLVFQEATRDEVVPLTEAQRLRLTQMAESQQAGPLRYWEWGVTWSSVGLEQMGFEQQLLAAQMLEQNLVAQRAGAAPSPDPEEQALYEQARRELLDELRARANITVPPTRS